MSIFFLFQTHTHTNEEFFNKFTHSKSNNGRRLQSFVSHTFLIDGKIIHFQEYSFLLCNNNNDNSNNDSILSSEIRLNILSIQKKKNPTAKIKLIDKLDTLS